MNINFRIIGSNALSIRSGADNEMFFTIIYRGSASASLEHEQFTSLLYDVVFKLSPEGRGVDIFRLGNNVNVTIEWCDLSYPVDNFLDMMEEGGLTFTDSYNGIQIFDIDNIIYVTKEFESIDTDDNFIKFEDEKLETLKGTFDHSYEWGAGHGYEGFIQVVSFLSGFSVNLGVNYISARIEDYRKKIQSKNNKCHVLSNFNLPESVVSLLKEYDVKSSDLTVRNISGDDDFYGLVIQVYNEKYDFHISLDNRNKVKNISVTEIKK